MPDMERADDFVIIVTAPSASAANITSAALNYRRLAVPRACKLIKSFWLRESALDGTTVDVKFAHFVKGDLADHFTTAVAGAAGDVAVVHHRDEANNPFAAGDVLDIIVVDPSASGVLAVTIVLRPL